MNRTSHVVSMLAAVGAVMFGTNTRATAAESVGTLIRVPLLDLDFAAGQPVATEPKKDEASKTPAQPAQAAVKPAGAFGVAGSNWFSVGVGYMHDFEEDQAAEIHLGISHFIADELEFNVELTGWYFDQTGDNTGGVNPGFNFRWHFLHDAAYDWTVFGEIGIGLLFAFDEVPDGGTGFNFTPRAGVGFTTKIDDQGDRLQLGLRWQHISNGRIEGDARNPGRDSLMGYVGIMFPF